MDLIDAHRVTSSGNRYILTTTDYFTKYVEAVPIKDKSAESVAKAIYKVFCRRGSPVHIISDQGREFVNKVNLWLLICCMTQETSHDCPLKVEFIFW